jgi:membrane protein implicated in regulation of membrane protease activity
VNDFSSLFVWANLPYISVFTIAVVFAILQMTGVLGLLVGDSDHDADADADHDVDADADHDVDADGDHDADADNDADHEQDGGLGDKILIDLGVGRVPFSTLWQAFAITFGISGLALNSLVLAPRGFTTPSTLAVTLPIALVISYLVTRTLTRVLGRALAGEHEEASSRKDLIGSTGTVISSQITNDFGEIRVTDKAGRFMHLICRIREGEKSIPLGREVVIIDYDGQTGHIFVSPLDMDLAEEKPKHGKSKVRVTEKKDEASAAAENEAAAEEEATAAREKRTKRD